MSQFKSHCKGVIGSSNSFWLYDSQSGFDLTHPPSPTSPPISPRLNLTTTAIPITIDPKKSALLIIDMQNFFLSPYLGRPKNSKGLQAQEKLIKYAIPAARKAGIRIIWLNWGLTATEIETMPPGVLRALGFDTKVKEVERSDNDPIREKFVDALDLTSDVVRSPESLSNSKIKASGRDEWTYVGFGSEIGKVMIEGDGVEGGKLLMRDQWNSALTPELEAEYEKGLEANPPDIWIHKNRMSGLWGNKTQCTEFLEAEGIKTLFFSGVNTDQCVGASLQDAFNKGWDCILLNDGAATTSPNMCQESIEFNCAKGWGFCMKCEDLAEGVEKMK